MKKAGLTVLAVLVFVAGAMTAVWRGWGSGEVFATIRNDLDIPVSSATYYLTSCGYTTELNTGAIDAGASKEHRFSVCGEAGYRLDLKLADGTVVSNQAVYVERGYRVTDVLNVDGVRTDYDSFGY